MSKPATDTKKNQLHKLQQYSLGFGLSIVLTITAYLLTVHHIFRGWELAYAIVALAVIQVIVQLAFFLHIGHESEPRWNLLMLDFTLIVVVIIVIGSLWIMNHLNYHMDGSNNGLSPDTTNNYIIQDEGFQQK
jgi:cytochrome o ubiquinol oxidase operon protein cyoD